MALFHVMHVVSGDEVQPEILRPLNQVAIDLGLFGDRVVLEFEIKIFRAERLLEPIHGGARLIQPVLLDQFGNFTGETSGKHDEALVVLRQNFFVDARLVVIALQMRRGGESDQVLVARLVLRQQDKMMVNVLAAAGRLFVEATAGRNIHLATDDRFDAFVASGLIKIDRAVEHTVVGDREGGKLQFMRLVHQPVEAAGAVEQRILGVQMEVDKIRMRHEARLSRPATQTQERVVHALRLCLPERRRRPRPPGPLKRGRSPGISIPANRRTVELKKNHRTFRSCGAFRRRCGQECPRSDLKSTLDYTWRARITNYELRWARPASISVCAAKLDPEKWQQGNGRRFDKRPGCRRSNTDCQGEPGAARQPAPIEPRTWGRTTRWSARPGRRQNATGRCRRKQTSPRA